mmetsp:Transcript_8256/g.21280  ORF Transcript_8256/g.21280 Transcript_8256/m.21280 type:complete len:221 (+) Transcript_8256:351-1013(+)
MRRRMHCASPALPDAVQRQRLRLLQPRSVGVDTPCMQMPLSVVPPSSSSSSSSLLLLLQLLLLRWPRPPCWWLEEVEEVAPPVAAVEVEVLVEEVVVEGHRQPAAVVAADAVSYCSCLQRQPRYVPPRLCHLTSWLWLWSPLRRQPPVVAFACTSPPNPREAYFRAPRVHPRSPREGNLARHCGRAPQWQLGQMRAQPPPVCRACQDERSFVRVRRIQVL